MPHDKNDVTIERGDRVILTGFVRDIYPTNSGDCNVTIVIDAPDGTYHPIYTLNSKSLDVIRKNAEPRWWETPKTAAGERGT